MTKLQFLEFLESIGACREARNWVMSFPVDAKPRDIWVACTEISWKEWLVSAVNGKLLMEVCKLAVDRLPDGVVEDVNPYAIEECLETWEIVLARGYADWSDAEGVLGQAELAHISVTGAAAEVARQHRDFDALWESMEKGE